MSYPINAFLSSGGRNALRILPRAASLGLAIACTSLTALLPPSLQRHRCLWSRRVSAPPVDFSRYVVAVAALGTRPNGAWSVAIDSVIDGWTERLVYVHEIERYGCPTTAALTAPVAMRRLGQSDATTRFVYRNERLKCGPG
jgi:hypothetical protein